MGNVGARDITEYAQSLVAQAGGGESTGAPRAEHWHSFVRARAEGIADAPLQAEILRQNRRRKGHLLADAAVLTVLFIAGLANQAALVLLYVMLLVSWVWMSVVFVQGSNRKDRARAKARDHSERLADIGMKAIDDVLEHRRRMAEAERESERIAAAAGIALARQSTLDERAARGTPAPEPQTFGVSHEGAEALVAQWMRHLGEHDAEVTRFVGDGGIDVAGSSCIAQVKNYAGTVGVAEVRELAGVAFVDGRRPLFFTSGTFALGAIEFAAKSNVALFTYDAVKGTLAGVNEKAASAIATGLESTSRAGAPSDVPSLLEETHDGGDEGVELFRPFYRLQFLVLQAFSWTEGLLRWAADQKQTLLLLDESGSSTHLGHSYEHFEQNLAWATQSAEDDAGPLTQEVVNARDAVIADLDDLQDVPTYLLQLEQTAARLETALADWVDHLDARSPGIRERAQIAFLKDSESEVLRRQLLLLGFDLERLR